MFGERDLSQLKYDDRSTYRQDFINRFNWQYEKRLQGQKKAGPEIKFDASSTYRHQFFDKLEQTDRTPTNTYWTELNSKSASGVLPNTSGTPYTEKRMSCPTPDWLKELKAEMDH